MCVNSASTVLRGAGANWYISLISAASSAKSGGNGNAKLDDVPGETGLLDPAFATASSCAKAMADRTARQEGLSENDMTTR